MKLKRINKSVILLAAFVLMILVGIIYSGDSVEAATTVTVSMDDPKKYICFNKSTGDFVADYTGSTNKCGSGNGRDVLKYIGDTSAYCVNWKLKFYGLEYVKDETWKANSANAIKAGYLINYVNSQISDVEKAYARTGATLNSFFAKTVSDSGSYNFSTNSEIKGYLDKANSYYSTVNHSKILPAISIVKSNTSGVMKYNKTSKKYFSGKVTVSGFVATYGGDATSYTVTATASNGQKIDICTDSLGKNCKSGSVSLGARSTAYSFYLFVSEANVSANNTITIKVTGSNKSTYYSSVLYKNSTDESMQKLLTIGEYEVPRSVSKSTVFTIPDLTNHTITVYKVDENGDPLSNAVLEIRRDSATGTLLATNANSGSAIVRYNTGDVAENVDDFFNHNYYLVEKSAPDGYVFTETNKGGIPIYTKGTATDTDACYKVDDDGLDEDDKVDNEYCNPSDYVYKCKSSTGEIKDPDENGNCLSGIVIEPDQTEDGDGSVTQGNEGTSDTNAVETQEETDGTGDATDNGTGDDTNASTGNDENNPSAVYTKVCYKVSAESVVDDSYCNNQNGYIKVEVADGNILVMQTNSKNLVRISKQEINGSEEVIGASLKICTEADYNNQKEECTPAKTIDGIEMSWMSDDTAHSIYGVPKGSYYIIEVTPPKGYIQATIATSFSIDEYGTVKSGDTTITNEEFKDSENPKALVIENELTKITISKQDIATSKELPGATISICRTYTDENGDIQMLVDQYTGECIEATLADGSVASWISTNEPKVIEGLRADRTYYLVEKIAPTDYSTAESILFTLKSDGTLVDKDGKSLSGNKLVMKDEPIENEKTGSFAIYVVGGVIVVVTLLGVGSYYYLTKVNGKKKNK